VRFLSDQSCDFAVVRAFRAARHDVRSAREESPSIPDDDVAAWAVADDRIVLAEDKDFGHLVHVPTVPCVGVVFLRFPASARSTMSAQVCDAVARLGERLRGAFAVIQPGKVRVTRGIRPSQPRRPASAR
jgi:predicted nuclease of predicted toxin-antitoxin system